MQRFHEIRKSNVCLFIIVLEVAIVLHIVDIAPHYIQWEFTLLIPLNDCLHFIKALVGVPALVPTEDPLREQHWLAYD